MNESLNLAVTRLKNSNNILLVAASGSLDSAAAALALFDFLQKQGKKVSLTTNGPITAKYEFLPQARVLLAPYKLAKTLAIEISEAHAQVGELSYQKIDDKLIINIAPKSGEFSQADVAVSASVYPFDLVVAVGFFNLEGLGKIYEQHAQLFFETPILNLDNGVENENFGQFNVVNLTASGVSEIVFDFLTEYDANFIDEQTATLLLAGLVSVTDSFQSQKTTPQAFLKASKLVSLGARQQEIITKLYRSKSMGLLRLWGRVLARLKQERELNMVYSQALATDLERSEATTQDIDEIIFEMKSQLSFAKTFVFCAEIAGQTTVYVSTSSPINLSELFAVYNPLQLGSGTYKFTVQKNLIEAEAEVLNTIRASLSLVR